MKIGVPPTGMRLSIDRRCCSRRSSDRHDVRHRKADFGDGWEHLVEFESWLTLEPKLRVATCIDGARARSREDVGGPNGYLEFLAIMADPKHPEHADTKRWAGGHFDPEWFDLQMIDPDVRNALRANRRIRMHQPSQRRRKREP